jgi:hypothetical protein
MERGSEMDDMTTKIWEVDGNYLSVYQAGTIRDALVKAGYRLDPYPNGKSKPELIAIIEAKQAELDRARVFLHEVKRVYLDENGGSMIARCDLTERLTAFLTETSTVEQQPELDDDGTTHAEVTR